MKNKKNWRYSVGAALLVGSYLILSAHLGVTDGSADGMSVAQEFRGALALQNIERNGTYGLLLIRIGDGKEQFFPGEWKTSYSGAQSLFVYNNKDIYFFDAENTIRQFTFPGEGEEIDLVSLNETRSHLFIKTTKVGDYTNYCLSPLPTNVDKKIICDNLTFNHATGQGVWNPKKPSEFIALNSQKDLFVWNMGNEKPTFISKDTESELFQSTIKVFESKPHETENSYVRAFNFLFYKTSAGTSAIHVPLSYKLIPILENRLFVMINKDTLGILNPATKKYATIFRGENLLDRDVTGPL